MSKILNIPQAMYTVLGGNAVIPNVSTTGSVLCPPDSYEAVAEAPLGLQLDRSEWGNHAYALRRSIFSSDVVTRIERAEADDFYAIAKGYEDWGGGKMFPNDAHRFSLAFVAMRAAAWGFARDHNDDAAAVRAFGKGVDGIMNASPLSYLDRELDLLVGAVYEAFECEARACPAAMKVLEILAFGGDVAAMNYIGRVQRSLRGNTNGALGSDFLSLQGFVKARDSRQRAAELLNEDDLMAEVRRRVDERRAMQQAFNESPDRDSSIETMIEHPAVFAGAILEIMRDDFRAFENYVELIARCNHPRLNEAIESVHAEMLRNIESAAFYVMCYMLEWNLHAWKLLAGVAVDELLKRLELFPDRVEPLHRQLELMLIAGREPGSIAAALAQLDKLDMPEDELTLHEWVAVGSQRAREILEERWREAPGHDDAIETGEGAAVISLRDHLKSTDSE